MSVLIDSGATDFWAHTDEVVWQGKFTGGGKKAKSCGLQGTGLQIIVEKKNARRRTSRTASNGAEIRRNPAPSVEIKILSETH